MQKLFYAALALMVTFTSAVSIKAGYEALPWEEEVEMPETPQPTCRHVKSPWFEGWTNDVDNMLYDMEEHCDRALSNLGH